MSKFLLIFKQKKNVGRQPRQQQKCVEGNFCRLIIDDMGPQLYYCT